LPTKRRVYAHEGDYELVKEPLLVKIDMAKITLVSPRSLPFDPIHFALRRTRPQSRPAAVGISTANIVVPDLSGNRRRKYRDVSYRESRSPGLDGLLLVKSRYFSAALEVPTFTFGPEQKAEKHPFKFHSPPHLPRPQQTPAVTF
jgi:hypothetical protein